MDIIVNTKRSIGAYSVTKSLQYTYSNQSVHHGHGIPPLRSKRSLRFARLHRWQGPARWFPSKGTSARSANRADLGQYKTGHHISQRSIQDAPRHIADFAPDQSAIPTIPVRRMGSEVRTRLHSHAGRHSACYSQWTPRAAQHFHQAGGKFAGPASLSVPATHARRFLPGAEQRGEVAAVA